MIHEMWHFDKVWTGLGDMCAVQGRRVKKMRDARWVCWLQTSSERDWCVGHTLPYERANAGHNCHSFMLPGALFVNFVDQLHRLSLFTFNFPPCPHP